jgi:phosphatidylserine/phosphatidylglycerophosphate/cardiolipin synthase-like enzyme
MKRFSSLIASIRRPLRSLQPALGLTTAALAITAVLGVPTTAAAQDWLCDTAEQDCRSPLIDLIRAETEGIDVAFWFMEDPRYPVELKRAQDRGVRVRVLMDLKANSEYPLNASRLNELRDAGIPMRQHLTGSILHWKMMLFEAQNVVEFSAANYSGSAFVPEVPYADYVAEVIYFSQRQSVINSFKTRFDDHWTDTTTFSNYANITGTPTRAHATFPIDPELNLTPVTSGQKNFRTRSLERYNAETDQIDATMFRITDQQHTNSLIAAHNRGITVRLITEPDQYRERSRLWHSWNVDRLYVAGIQVRHRAHAGLIHQKSTILHSQGMTIFGSSNWTSPSANSQVEHNYFTTRPDFYTFFRNQFERKWNNTAPGGIDETEPFVPLPPDTPVNKSPANGATGLANTVTLMWDPQQFGHIYDVYFGTSSNPPLIAADLALGPRESMSQLSKFKFVVSELAPGTKYFWRVRSRTMASCVDAPGVTPCAAPRLSSVWSFTTAGGPPPPPPPPGVLLSDDFNSTTLDTAKWTKALFTGTQDTTIPVTVDGASLVVGPLKSGVTGSHYNGIRSKSSFSFTGVSAEVELVEPAASSAPDAYAMFAVGKSNFYYRWYVAGTSLVAEKRASSKTTLATLTYSASSHRFLRIRHNAATGQVVFETAPDAGGAPGAWTTRFSQTWDAAIPLTGVMIELKGGTSSAQTNPGPVRWDKVRVGTESASSPPPPSTTVLNDDFSSTTLDARRWLAGNLFTGTQDSTIPLAISEGTLAIGPLKSGASGSHYYGVRSRNSFSFSGVSAEVELVERPSPSAADAYAMFAVGRNNYYYRWYVAGDSLVAEKRAVSKTTLASLAYDTTHQYLRIHHDDATNRVVFATAPDVGGEPGTWTTRFSQTWDPAIPLTGVMLELKGGTSSAETNPGRVRWDNVLVETTG